MQLQFKRNNIAGKGMQLSVGAIQLNLNRLSTLFNYQCGNARIHFTNEFAVGELKLQSSGLESIITLYLFLRLLLHNLMRIR